MFNFRPIRCCQNVAVNCAYGDPIPEAAARIVGADGAGGVVGAPVHQLSMSQLMLGSQTVRSWKITSSLLSQHRTIVLHKQKKVFGSFLVTEESSTPYSDATFQVTWKRVERAK